MDLSDSEEEEDFFDLLADEEEPENEHSNEAELAGSLSSLVLLHFFYGHFNQRYGESFETFRRRRNKIIRELFPVLPKKGTFPTFPTHSLVSAYPLAVVCKCGHKIAEGNFGVIESCLECFGPRNKLTNWYPYLTADTDLCYVPKAWHNWAESVAIQLETARKIHSAAPPCNPSEAIP